MKLENANEEQEVYIHDFLDGILNVVANCKIDKEVMKQFSDAQTAIVEQIFDEDFAIEELLRLTIIFTSNGKFTLSIDDSNTRGTMFNLAVYNLGAMENIDSRSRLCCLIEEMVHHFWRTEDETEAKRKVVQIAQRIDETITIELMESWGTNWK